jgi:hypothetical protein
MAVAVSTKEGKLRQIDEKPVGDVTSHLKTNGYGQVRYSFPTIKFLIFIISHFHHFF